MVKRTLRLRLDRFGRESLTARAAHERVSPDEVASRAAAYLDRDLEDRRPSRHLPRGLPESKAQNVELHLELGESEWTSLEAKAQREGVTLERLLEHALLLYIADVASGRVAETILRRAEEEG